VVACALMFIVTSSILYMYYWGREFVVESWSNGTNGGEAVCFW